MPVKLFSTLVSFFTVFTEMEALETNPLSFNYTGLYSLALSMHSLGTLVGMLFTTEAEYYASQVKNFCLDDLVSA